MIKDFVDYMNAGGTMEQLYATATMMLPTLARRRKGYIDGEIDRATMEARGWWDPSFEGLVVKGSAGATGAVEQPVAGPPTDGSGEPVTAPVVAPERPKRRKQTTPQEGGGQAPPPQRPQPDHGGQREPERRGRRSHGKFIVPGDRDAMGDIMDLLRTSWNERTKVLRVLPSLHNAMIILDQDPRWADRITFCEFRTMILVDEEPIQDIDAAEMAMAIEDAYHVTFSVQTMHEAMSAIAHRRKYHPVRAWLNSLVWDKTQRLDRWLVTYGGVKKDDLGYGPKFCISAVARIMNPGCQADSVLILTEPKQGAGKTSLVRTLAGGPPGREPKLEWSSDSALPIGDKDAYQQLQGVWIYELGELASLRRSDIETIKGFITSRVDKYRPSYGRHTVQRPRQCVFFGTSNEKTFLPEGGRRWWICDVTQKIDLEGLRKNREQLWAEAVHRYNSGEMWWFMDETLIVKQRERTDAFVQVDPWHDTLEAFVDGENNPMIEEGIAQDDLFNALNIPIERRTRTEENRVGAILRKLGFESRRVTPPGGRRHRRWFRRPDWVKPLEEEEEDATVAEQEDAQAD